MVTYILGGFGGDRKGPLGGYFGIFEGVGGRERSIDQFEQKKCLIFLR